MKTTTRSVLLVLTFLCLAFVEPTLQAVVPAPDGGYPGGNTAEGQNALLSVTSGGYNTALGYFSLRSDTTGSFNTGVGAGTLFASTGDQNTATGAGALLSNTTGAFNTANGAFALFSNTGGPSNTAVGYAALFNNTTGDRNTAMGDGALLGNQTGASNTAMGVSALRNNVTGSYNTAVGHDALVVNQANGNTAVGFRAAYSNTTGLSNTAIGYAALFANDVGESNTAIGTNALTMNTTGCCNTAVGYAALSQNVSGLNTAIGYRAGINIINGFDNIYIGSEGGGPNETNTMRLGRSGDAPTLSTYIAGIFGRNISGTAVYIDSDGQLGTVNSSRRFKQDIKPIDQASEAILSLKPVTFHYNSDTKAIPQFGLIAEEVAEVNPDLVVRDKNGEIYTVRYDAVNAMLLNEFLKEHRKIEQQETTIAELKKGMEALTARLNDQAALMEKVSAQIETSEAVRQVASRD